jgi:hypothetical protein
MPTVTYRGRVFPAGLNLTISPVTIGWKNPITNLNGEIEVTVTNGVLTAICELSLFDEEQHMALLYKEAFEIAGVMMTMLSFATGWGTTLVFETITLPNGVTTEIRPGNETLGKECTAYSAAGPDMLTLLPLIMAEPQIHYCLRDLNELLSVPNRVNINCGRVIDAIRNMILPTPPEGDRRASWAKMQSVLNLDPKCVRYIGDSSVPHRHGDFVPFDGKTTSDLSERTWKIMNRFLEYRKRQNQPLTAPEFPLLA